MLDNEAFLLSKLRGPTKIKKTINYIYITPSSLKPIDSTNGVSCQVIRCFRCKKKFLKYYMKKTKLNVYIEIKENRFLNYLCS